MNSKLKKTSLQKLQEWFIMDVLAKVKWKQQHPLTEAQLDTLNELLSDDYFIIATRRSNFLTSFFINFGHFLLTGKFGFYTHVLMNLENEVATEDDFRFIEATTHGTKYSTFDQVFSGVDAVSLIKPKDMTLDEWTECLDAARLKLGTPYDSLFNIKNDQEINCVELIRIALQALPDYSTRFANLEKLLAKKKKLTPQMIVDCPDFHVYIVVK
jgi:hypothetical protein